MSDVSGTISYSLSISDSTTLPTKTVLKTIQVNEETDIASGAAIVLSGTAGTALTSINLEPSTYRNASGDFVSFTDSLPPTVVAVQADNANVVQVSDVDLGLMWLNSASGHAASSSWPTGSDPAAGLYIRTLGGTNSYTVVVFRKES